MRHFISLRINPLEIFYKLRVGDLGPAGQDHILPRSDGLCAFGEDEQVGFTSAGAKFNCNSNLKL